MNVVFYLVGDGLFFVMGVVLLVDGGWFVV